MAVLKTKFRDVLQLRDYLMRHPHTTLQEIKDLLDPETAAPREAIRQEMGGNVTPQLAAILQAVGAASVCWSNVDKAGVFDSQSAAEIAEDLYAQLELKG